MMRCADFVEPGKIAFRDDATIPEPSSGEVLIKVSACGICGSDLHMFRHNSYRAELVRRTPEGYEIPGHEFSGVIAKIGSGVAGWSVGERVVGVTGQGGGMADYVVVPVNPFQLVRIPENVTDAEAATTEPLADGLQMARKGNPAPGENVVVFGVGIIGLGVIQAIHARGLSPGRIIAVDVHDVRLEAALAQGATHVVNARNGDVFEQIAAITGTETGYAGVSARIGVVFDCAGYIRQMAGPPPLETALRLIDLNGGRIVCFGGFEGPMTIDFSPVIQKQPTIMGSNGYAAEELTEALALMSQGRVQRAELISHRFALEDIAQAFEAQGAADAVKVLIEI
jgi:(R,R)-butanediol dehydrogenase/meso-butanediol dehydrogenase/diacetyl reductase